MKASETKLLSFIKKSFQFAVPVYQRNYTWTEKECKRLWDDILRTGRDDKTPSHFVGSVVYIESGLYHVSCDPPLSVIDGQQRLTTVSLLVEALARHVSETDQEPEDGFSAQELREYYLCNRHKKGDRYYKLLLSRTDKDSLLSLLKQKDPPKEYSQRIQENFDFFKKEIQKLSPDDIKALCNGMDKLVIVDISLHREQDDPQLIFESMNSAGLELSQADLIRNFILMNLEQERQTELYETHWRCMEEAFGQEAYKERFDLFIRDYLTIKTPEIPKKENVYETFKKHARGKEKADLAKDVHVFADYYCAAALGQEENPSLKSAFSDLKKLKVNVSYPFILKLYRDYKQGLLSSKDFLGIVRLIENYVFRRAVCEVPTNSLNKTFASCARRGRPEGDYLESVAAWFELLPSYRRFPKNNEFLEKLQSRDFYHFQHCRYFLDKWENHGRKERPALEEYSIEHILPQNENLSPKWREALGPNWKEIQEKRLHNLGNLTLTGYNSEYKDRFWTEKRDMKPRGFRESPLRLNEGLGQTEMWGENEIKERARRLAGKALTVWPGPSLSQEVLDKHRLEQKEPQEYSIANYKSLAEEGAARTLFTAFQKAVLALDPSVAEKFRKDHISYFSEGARFAKVLPSSKHLRVILFLEIHELHDPRGAAFSMDLVAGKRPRVQVKLKSLEDLPYIMSLVRQALDKQIFGENEAA